MRDFPGYNFLPESDEDNADFLQALIDYYLKELYGDPLSASWRDGAEIIGEIIGGSAGIYYGPSAYQYAINLSLWLKISFIAGNAISGSLFLIKATRDCFERLSLERHVPDSLRKMLKLPENKDLVIKYLKMFFGSALCSTPMAIAAILFPLPGCVSTACLSVTATHSGVSNTILHGVSWELMLDQDNWFFRLPYLIITLPYKLYQKLSFSSAQIQLAKLQQEKTVIYLKYKNILSQFFTANLEKIVSDDVRFRKQAKDSKSTSIREIIASEAKVSTLAKLSTVENKQTDSSQPSSISRIWYCCTAAHQLMKNKGVALIGGTIMVVGSIGWEANPIYIGLKHWGLNLWQSILVGGLPAYSMTVLAAFYGAMTIKQIYDYLTTWDKNTNKLPIEAKLYPKTFTVILLINLYLSFFSFATGEILITTIFDAETWGMVRTILEYDTYPALQILSFVPLLNLSIDIMRRCIAKFGSDDNKICARLLIKSDIIRQRFQQVHGDKLMNSIELYDANQQKSFGVDPIQFKEDKFRSTAIEREIFQLEQELQDENKPQPQTSRCWDSLCNFFPRPSHGEQYPLLTVNSPSLQTAY